MRALAAKSRLFRDDDGILHLVRKLTPPAPACPDKPGGRAARLLHNEPARIYVPLLMRPWIMHACHSNASCYRDVDRTLSMLELFYWWIGMDICTWWWLRRCLQCQARKSSRQTVRWPILSLPLPSGPGVAVSVDDFGPLLVTPLRNSYILLSRVDSALAQTCTPSLLRNSRLRAPPISWSTSIYLFGVSGQPPLR